MQPGFYGQTPPMMGGTPQMGMPPEGTPPMGMPYGGMPFMPPMGMPYGGMPFPPTMPNMGMGTTMQPSGALHCPACGYSGPVWHAGASPTSASPGTYGGYPYWSGFGGLGGLRRHGGSYSPQFTATGLPTDEEITEMAYDAMDVDPLIPYDADINIDCDAGIITLTGTVPNKRAKHAAGDDSWWVPGVVDVKNELQISGRRRARSAPTETGERRS